jgi:hypothetical protein
MPGSQQGSGGSISGDDLGSSVRTAPGEHSLREHIARRLARVVRKLEF